MALFLFTKNILKNKPIQIFNRGNHIRDFTYVDDVAKSVFYISKKIPKKNKSIKNKNLPAESSAPFNVVNIGNNKPIQLLEYVKQIELKLKKKSRKKYLPLQRGDIRMTIAENKKIKK